MVLWNILTKEEQDLVLLKLLVHIALVDGVLLPQEFSYLVSICHTQNINPEKIRDFIHIKDVEINEILPTDEADRMNFLYHALFVMNADKDVAAAEMIYVYKLAFRLGFSEAMTREFIDLLRDHTSDDMPKDAMLNIIRKYNN